MSSVRFLAILAVALVTMQSLVSAHFTLTYPSSRGFDETKEPTAPCGGFDTPSAQRVQMPLKSSFIEIDSGHVSYSYQINAVTKQNPTVSDFSSGTVQVGQGSRSTPQAACLPLTFNDSFKANTNVTLQVVYNGGDGLLYQCVDAVLVDDAPNFDKSKCVNADGSATNLGSSTASPSSSGSASASSSTTTPNGATSAKTAYGLTFAAAVFICVLLA